MGVLTGGALVLVTGEPIVSSIALGLTLVAAWFIDWSTA